MGQVPVNNNIIHSSDIQPPELGHAIPRAVAPRHNVYTKKVTVTGSIGLRPTIGLKLQSWLALASLAQDSPPSKQVSHWRFLRRFRAGRRCLHALCDAFSQAIGNSKVLVPAHTTTAAVFGPRKTSHGDIKFCLKPPFMKLFPHAGFGGTGNSFPAKCPSLCFQPACRQTQHVSFARFQDPPHGMNT